MSMINGISSALVSSVQKDSNQFANNSPAPDALSFARLLTMQTNINNDQTIGKMAFNDPVPSDLGAPTIGKMGFNDPVPSDLGAPTMGKMAFNDPVPSDLGAPTMGKMAFNDPVPSDLGAPTMGKMATNSPTAFQNTTNLIDTKMALQQTATKDANTINLMLANRLSQMTSSLMSSNTSVLDSMFA